MDTRFRGWQVLKKFCKYKFSRVTSFQYFEIKKKIFFLWNRAILFVFVIYNYFFYNIIINVCNAYNRNAFEFFGEFNDEE